MSDTSFGFDLITLGDSTIDTFIKIENASIVHDADSKDSKICVPYGSKIPVDEIDFGIAGNAANVVMGCSKLGLKSAIYTNLGEDDQATRIKEAFKGAGVAMNYVIDNPGMKSNLSVVLTFQGERTIFVYHQDWTYQLPKLAACKWLYLTSMAETFTSSNIMDEVCHYLDKSKAKLVFSPGTFQIKADVKRYPMLLEKCYLLIVNLEEARKILNIDPTDKHEVKEILQKLLMLGPKMAVITDGAEGSYATDGKSFYKAGIVKTVIREKTGAGDAYSSAFIAALNQNLPIPEAMVWGAINSSSVISQMTTQKGHLTHEELLKLRGNMAGFEAGNL